MRKGDHSQKREAQSFTMNTLGFSDDSDSRFKRNFDCCVVVEIAMEHVSARVPPRGLESQFAPDVDRSTACTNTAAACCSITFSWNRGQTASKARAPGAQQPQASRRQSPDEASVSNHSSPDKAGRCEPHRIESCQRRYLDQVSKHLFFDISTECIKSAGKRRHHKSKMASQMQVNFDQGEPFWSGSKFQFSVVS